MGVDNVYTVQGFGSFINIDFDMKRINQTILMFQRTPQEIKRAASRAVNRSLDTFKTVAIRETTRKYFVKRKDIAPCITPRRPHGDEPYGSILARGTRRSLLKYKTNTATTSIAHSITPGTFKAAVRRLGGLKPIPLVSYIDYKNGTFYPVLRTSLERKYLASPSIPQLVKNKETVAEAEKQAGETFERRLMHELKEGLKHLGALP